MPFQHSYSSNTIIKTQQPGKGRGWNERLGTKKKKKTLCTVYNLPTAIRNTYNLHLKSLEIRLRDGKVSEGSGILVKILKGNTTYFRSCHTVFLCSRTSQLVFTNMHRSVWKLEADRLEHWFFFFFFLSVTSWWGYIQSLFSWHACTSSAQVRGYLLWSLQERAVHVDENHVCTREACFISNHVYFTSQFTILQTKLQITGSIFLLSVRTPMGFHAFSTAWNSTVK